MKKVTEKKKFRLKKSARLTIAGACAVTALVVAVIRSDKFSGGPEITRTNFKGHLLLPSCSKR